MAAEQPFTALAICPHADDAAVFFGGTLMQFAAEGWRTIIVRVTDDAKDSVGLTREETIKRNAEELREAAAIMGVSEIIELGYETDSLGDVSEVALRERFVYLFREYRPYAVFSFDREGYDEDNMDHVVTSQAVDEALWVARFDLHHPEHFDEGLQPFAVCERWYYGRDLPRANCAVDVTDYMERRVDAVCAHRTPVKNMVNQYRLQLETWGRRSPMLDGMMDGDPREAVELVLCGACQAIAQKHGLPEGRCAEEYRLVRFGGLEAFFQEISEPIPGQRQGPKRKGLDA